MPLKRVPYRSLRALLRRELLTEEHDATAALIRRLAHVKGAGRFTRAEFLAMCRWKSPRSRRLAESALDKLGPYFPGMKSAWTARGRLPGSDFVDRESAKRDLLQRYSQLAPNVLQGVFRRHGTLAARVLGDGRLGEYFGAGLTERELGYLIEHEWAHTAEDILWRRTKCGLRMTEAQRARVVQFVGR